MKILMEKKEVCRCDKFGLISAPLTIFIWGFIGYDMDLPCGMVIFWFLLLIPVLIIVMLLSHFIYCKLMHGK